MGREASRSQCVQQQPAVTYLRGWVVRRQLRVLLPLAKRKPRRDFRRAWKKKSLSLSGPLRPLTLPAASLAPSRPAALQQTGEWKRHAARAERGSEERAARGVFSADVREQLFGGARAGPDGAAGAGEGEGSTEGAGRER